MTTAAEVKNPNLFERLRRWKSSIPWLNTRVPDRFIAPVFSLCLGARYQNGWGGHAGIGRADVTSLFFNGAFFVRLVSLGYRGVPVQLFAAIAAGAMFSWWWMLAAGLWCLGIRWAGSDQDKREFAQMYFGGAKLNGEWVIVPRMRAQSDNSAAAGTTGPNPDQARGWNAGPK